MLQQRSLKQQQKTSATTKPAVNAKKTRNINDREENNKNRKRDPDNRNNEKKNTNQTKQQKKRQLHEQEGCQAH